MHLLIDRTEIEGIRSLKINVEPNEPPTITLDLDLIDLSITSDFLMYQKGLGAINFVRAEEQP